MQAGGFPSGFTFYWRALFTALADILGSKVCLSRDKYNTMCCLESEQVKQCITTDWKAARVHVLPMMQLTFKVWSSWFLIWHNSLIFCLLRGYLWFLMNKTGILYYTLPSIGFSSLCACPSQLVSRNWSNTWPAFPASMISWWPSNQQDGRSASRWNRWERLSQMSVATSPSMVWLIW